MVLFCIGKVGDILLFSYGDSIMKCDSLRPSPLICIYTYINQHIKEGALLDTNQIERKSINKLEGIILDTNIIEPEIKSNDKYPSWDGELLVYKSSNFVKSNLHGRVPVQVKGHYEQPPFEKEISYSYNVDDLRNYFYDGGVFYFVVYIEENGKFAIYYEALLPFDLKKLINEADKNDRSSIRSRLKIIKDNSPTYLIMQIKNFLLHASKQKGTIKLNSQKPININEVTFHLISDKSLNTLFEQPAYLYAKPSGFDVEIPFEKYFLKELDVTKKITKIVIGSETYTVSTKYCMLQNESKFYIDKSFMIDFVNGRLKYNLKGTLPEQINDLEILISLSKYKSIQIDESIPAFPVNLEINNQQVIQLNSDLEYLHKIQGLLKELYVNKELNLDILSDIDYENLNLLLEFYNKNKSAELDDFEGSPLAKMIIGNIVVALGATKTGDKMYQLGNPFSSSFLKGHFFVVDESGNHYPCCLAAIL